MGEAQSVLILLEQLLAQYPGLHLLMTTGTVTSATLVKRAALPRTIHQYLPSDIPLATRRFLNHWRPDLVLWAESELWPVMLSAIHRRGVPLVMINARMSEASMRRWQRLPRFTRQMLAAVTLCFAMSEEDAARFRTLGAAKLR